ncbi:LacI family DNA-binding transcriptional regulator [Acidocella sp.]|uniref:LacI family DNA-binding transcriptional regulator n=1 Tax=Acidocella sp. TaxID=50710 RepID=UPI003CFD054E
MERKRPTAYDVARLAGVSQSMVSRAFTDGASISAQAKERVLAVAKSLSYRPNMIARSLITQRSRLIGVAMSYMENQFYPTVLEELSREFAVHGYRVLLFTPGADGNPDPLLDEILRFQVAAVVLASVRMTSHFAEECAQVNVPVLLFNRRTSNQAVSSVTGQNIVGGRTIGSFLLAGGHERFAFVAGLEDSSTSQEREEGFGAALQAAGKKTYRREVGYYDFSAAQTAARRLFSSRERPDAVFCANDHTAIAVMGVAQSEFGLRVGEEVSIVGFDDVALAAWPSFQLTTYSQPVQTMSQRTVQLVQAFVEGRLTTPVHDIVAGELMIRRSARRPGNDWKPPAA